MYFSIICHRAQWLINIYYETAIFTTANKARQRYQSRLSVPSIMHLKPFT